MQDDTEPSNNRSNPPIPASPPQQGSAFPPTPQGATLLTVEVRLPPTTPGGVVCAGLKSNGRLIAATCLTAPHSQDVVLSLQGLTASDYIPPRECELWITINQADSTLISCYPTFGDTYRVEKITPPELPIAIQLDNLEKWQTRSLSAPENLVTIHYHRFDATYHNIGIWAWDLFQQRSPKHKELFPAGIDDYGLVFQFDHADYGPDGTADRIGFLIRMESDWNQKDGGDRCWIPTLGPDIYLIGGRNHVYSSPPTIAPHVSDAFIDTLDILHLHCSHRVTAEQVELAKIHLTDDTGHAIPLSASHLIFADSDGASKIIEVRSSAPLTPSQCSYQLRIDALGPQIDVVAREILDNREEYYEGDAVLGASYQPHATTFKVFAPTVTCATLILYDQATGDNGRRTFPMERMPKGIWELTIESDLDGHFYNYSFSGKDLRPEMEITDIYATNTVDSGRRARITALGSTDPHRWEHSIHGPKIESPVDAVIWEVHIRDLTMSPASGVKSRGLYSGFAEQGTHIPGSPSISTGIAHLVEMGVTHVQLLPVQDFDNEESLRELNWGYMTNYFNSPEGLFASNLNDESRVREFKELVAALHEQGIGVILDVVYNHTGTASPFDLTVPQYYYRVQRNGHYSNGSGCGNEFRSGSPMGRKFILDTLRHWVTEFGIDGFRFDLMALIDRDTMHAVETELRKINPDILIYGEPWQAAESILRTPTDKHGIQGTGIGAFNDDFRNAVKGSPDGSGGGFIQNGSQRDTVIQGLEGSHRLWSRNPEQVINYLTCHDNLTLYDKLKLSCPDAHQAQILAMTRLAHLIVFTSQGVPFLHAGCEFGRTKFGDHNSYQSPDSINQIDWTLKRRHHDLWRYVHGLIALRKAHPLFRLRNNHEIHQRIHFLPAPSGQTIFFTINGADLANESWRQACILLNAADDESIEFELPGGEWKIAYDPDGNTLLHDIPPKLRVPAKSGVILYQS